MPKKDPAKTVFEYFQTDFNDQVLPLKPDEIGPLAKQKDSVIAQGLHGPQWGKEYEYGSLIFQELSLEQSKELLKALFEDASSWVYALRDNRAFLQCLVGIGTIQDEGKRATLIGHLMSWPYKVNKLRGLLVDISLNIPNIGLQTHLKNACGLKNVDTANKLLEIFFAAHSPLMLKVVEELDLKSLPTRDLTLFSGVGQKETTVLR